jgi:hypothetical protein
MQTESTPTTIEIVLVEWADAHAGPGHWSDLDEDTGEHIVRTSGFLITEEMGGKKLHVTIAQSQTPDGFYDHVIYIPTGMIRTVSILSGDTTANATPQTLHS